MNTEFSAEINDLNKQKKVVLHKGSNDQLNLTFPANDDFIPLIVERLQVDSETDFVILNREELDNDTYEYLGAFKFINGSVIYVPEKMKEIQKNKFRIARKPILEKLDIEYMRALENNNVVKQQEIASMKQQLRDITDIPLPEDLVSIKNTWPSILVTD